LQEQNFEGDAGSKLGGPISSFIFRTINYITMGRKLDLSIKGKYTASQEARFRIVLRIITSGNIWLLKLTGGRLGNSFLGVTLLLMTTIGRKSGKPRTLPMYYLQDGEKFILVASNGGLPNDPVWLLNAMANPEVSIRLNGVKCNMLARLATADEKSQYWPSLAARFPMWEEVAERSNRVFKVVVLEPRE
jgi:deazaflavin-dependent oxidoreductase (nitroreductase family)